MPTSLCRTRMLPRGAANLNLQFDTSLLKPTFAIFQQCSSVLIFNLQKWGVGGETGVDYPLSLSIRRVHLSLCLPLQHFKFGSISAWKVIRYNISCYSRI